LFNVVKSLTGQPINFKHINDNKGIGCIIGDLDAAQAKGLGLYLCSIDSSKQWDEHLTHIFKSCVIHFQRYVINITLIIILLNNLTFCFLLFYNLEM
jgi:hypothetical protein